MFRAAKHRWLKAYLCLLAMPAYLGSQARGAQEGSVGASADERGVALSGIHQLVHTAAVREVLATLDYTPEGVELLVTGCGTNSLKEVHRCLQAVSPRKALQRHLVQEGYPPQSAAAVVASLTDEEVDAVVHYDAARGGYIIVAPVVIAAWAVVAVIVLAILGLVIYDQATKRARAEREARMMGNELQAEKLRMEVERLREQLEKVKSEQGTPYAPKPQF